MINENSPDLYTLEDENGEEQVFELLDVMEVDGEKYFALTPYYENPEDMLEDAGEVVILKSVFEGDEEMMVSFDENEEEYDRIGDLFMKRLDEMFDYGDEDDEPTDGGDYS